MQQCNTHIFQKDDGKVLSMSKPNEYKYTSSSKMFGYKMLAIIQLWSNFFASSAIYGVKYYNIQGNEWQNLL